MGWIEASLRFAGQFASGEKKAYMDRFGLGPGQVSSDQAHFAQEFNERYGSIVVEVGKGKLNIVQSTGLPPLPAFEMPSMTEWLQVMMGSAFLKVDSARRAEPSPTVLHSVVTAIRKRMPLDIVYLSRSSGKSRRIVSPHVIVDVAERLHLRGYDHARNRFSDFVLSRIQESGLADAGISFVPPDRDEEWRRRVTIEVRAYADLDGDRLQAVIQDFGLNVQASRLLQHRAALARYLIDMPMDPNSGFASPVSVRIPD
jgi:hypothetical protein